MKQKLPLTSPPFVVFTMPLSLDMWLARWLRCQRNGLMTSASLDGWIKSISAVAPFGSVESTLPTPWRTLRQRLPDARIAVVWRPSEEVAATYAHLGIEPDMDILRTHEAMLEAIACAPGVGVLKLPMTDVGYAIRSFWQFIQPKVEFDEDWFDECVEVRFPFELAKPTEHSVRLHVEALREASRLGGSATGLWLN